ncbi:UDP-2,4-diacetamido-2,4,6-trideoxy-beta-L-altropyranose hydrolase [Bacillus sp. FJAT-42315]|uniref:UDP-2,4-diacetamido-2,4, 6-trideoxy-beta-L-altropyranose hydrolase n=1 Tax=Bacillus sp. FJAT-42315 TaxID=2014077 RepID=UPI000C23CB3D|nr:UDP-2,4-diacetamido-2,4,6-trideoxy-beta-L-altropyranose hydrolase [Bacillus sp. FJAT-42315]
MNVIIRTDASIEIGTGHVMRCVTLAKQLVREGAKITFVCRELEGNVIDFIYSQGFHVGILPNERKKEDLCWTQYHWKQDATETKAVIQESNRQIDLLIVDHYGLDARWESELRSVCPKIMIIDDLANRPHNCDLLLDQTFGETGESYQNLIPPSAVGLYGLQYAILRDQFKYYRKQTFNYNQDDIRIHLFFGGIDENNYTFKFSDLILSHFPNVKIMSIVGRKFEFVLDLQQLERKYEGRFEWKKNIPNMAEYMQKCDIAFGAPGTATWERACVGLPSAYLAINKNQVNILENLQERGLCLFLGEASTIQTSTLISRLREFLTSPDLLRQLFVSSVNNVDGLGKNKIIQVLKELMNR